MLLCKSCAANRLYSRGNKGGKWLLQAAVFNHRARRVEAATASQAGNAANAALAAVFFALKKEQRTMLEAFSGEGDAFTWLSTDFRKSCVNNPTLHRITRRWHRARLPRCEANNSQRFICLWRVAKWLSLDGMDRRFVWSTCKFSFSETPFATTFLSSWGEHIVWRKHWF